MKEEFIFMREALFKRIRDINSSFREKLKENEDKIQKADNRIKVLETIMKNTVKRFEVK